MGLVITLIWLLIISGIFWGIFFASRRAGLPKREEPGRVDYDKIRRLERELGVGQNPADAPALPHPEDDRWEELRAWGQEAPVRRIDYRHRRRPDPKPRPPDQANPQTELK